MSAETPVYQKDVLGAFREEWRLFDPKCTVEQYRNKRTSEAEMIFRYNQYEIGRWLFFPGDVVTEVAEDGCRTLGEFISELRKWMGDLRREQAYDEASSWVAKMRAACDQKEQEFLLAKHALKLAEDALESVGWHPCEDE